jgi:hypothetical protein
MSLYTGGNTYESPIGGYNFPGYALKPFIRGEFDLTEYEEDLVNILKYVNGKFYVIGVPSDADSSVEKHELAHALWYLDSDYRDRVSQILYTIDPEKWCLISELLRQLGYDERVFEDEAQAYLCADYEWFMREALSLGLNLHISSRVSIKIQEEYYKALKRQEFSLKE